MESGELLMKSELGQQIIKAGANFKQTVEDTLNRVAPLAENAAKNMKKLQS